jgi:hypothetical protein
MPFSGKLLKKEDSKDPLSHLSNEIPNRDETGLTRIRSIYYISKHYIIKEVFHKLVC